MGEISTMKEYGPLLAPESPRGCGRATVRRNFRMLPSENPADIVLEAEAERPVDFPDLSERRSVKLASLTRYVARAHFHTWEQLRRHPDFETLEGVFTPLVVMEIDVTDARVLPNEMIRVRGRSVFGKVLDDSGEIRQITRDGTHTAFNESGTEIGRVRFVNVFTRYDRDPAKRRVLEIPEELGVGSVPSRVTEMPSVATMVPPDRAPDFPEGERNVWYYAQTDPNRHVNSLAYLNVAQEYVATRLHGAGLAMDRLWARRARLCFRKPCFRGEEYRRLAWRTGEDPLVVTTAIAKADDPEGHPAAAAVELTLAVHED